jgi:regulator of cell morphogenesis and NO signaling
MTSPLAPQTLGTIVANDYRAAAVLARFDLDFCCGGKRTLEEACRAKGIDPEQVAAQIHDELGSAPPGDGSDAAWDVDALVTHIVETHHQYVRTSAPRITAYLNKLVSVHGERHPELARVAEHFVDVGRELTSHMYKEEEILFPYIRALNAAVERGAAPPPNMFGTVQNPIRMMEIEHTSAGNELAMIRELTGDYATPADGCTTYQVCFRELEAFDADLRRHIHLENNVLFPRAVDLEQTAASGRTARSARLACRETVEFPGI